MVDTDSTLCIDCGMWTANRDLSGLSYYLDGDEEEARYNEVVESVADYETEHGSIVITCDEDVCGVDAHTSYSNRKECDVCGTTVYQYFHFTTI